MGLVETERLRLRGGSVQSIRAHLSRLYSTFHTTGSSGLEVPGLIPPTASAWGALREGAEDLLLLQKKISMASLPAGPVDEGIIN